jgi:hypothetical protein
MVDDIGSFDGALYGNNIPQVTVTDVDPLRGKILGSLRRARQYSDARALREQVAHEEGSKKSGTAGNGNSHVKVSGFEVRKEQRLVEAMSSRKVLHARQQCLHQLLRAGGAQSLVTDCRFPVLDPPFARMLDYTFAIQSSRGAGKRVVSIPVLSVVCAGESI